MKTFLKLLLFLALVPIWTMAQLIVNTNQTPAQLANIVGGQGVNISNVTYTGVQLASGSFTATNTNLGLNSGILLTTGLAANAVGPNLSGSTGSSNGAAGWPGVATSYDAAALTFNFVPSTNSITFRYVFGSDEYPEYVCSGFNDGFQLLISGPGIVGTQNIALIPNTTIPVAINSVNPGVPGGLYSSSGCTSLSYSNYYVNNANGATIEYDGFTTVLTATATVQPCQTYTLTFVIYDVGDDSYDSGVFIEENSLTSGAPLLSVNSPTICPGQNATLTANVTQTGGSFLWSTGATTSSISVSPTQTTNYTVNYTYGPCNIVYTQVATVNVTSAGVNVSINPSTVNVCPGQSVQLNGNVSSTGTQPVTFSTNTPVSIVDAGIFGGTTITRSPITVSGLPYGTISAGDIAQVCINISHTYLSDLVVYLECPNGTLVPLALNLGGASTLGYNNTCFVPTGAPLITTGSPPFTGTFTPQGNFATHNGCNANGSWRLYVIDQSWLDVGTINSWSITFNIPATIQTFSWSPTTSLTNSNTLTPTANPSQNTTYTLTATNSQGCTGTAQVTVNVGGSLTLNTQKVDADCGQNNGQAFVSVSGGGGPFTYLWSNGSNSALIQNLAAGTYTVTVTDPVGCTGNASVQIQTTGGNLTVNISSQDAGCGVNNGQAFVSVSGGTAPFLYVWSNGLTTSLIQNLAPGTYTVTATDQTGCVGTGTATIGSASTPTGPAGIWTWEGTVSNDWFDPCNWDKKTLPLLTSPVVVPGGTPNNPYIAADTAYCSTIDIFVINGGEIVIDVNNNGFLLKQP